MASRPKRWAKAVRDAQEAIGALKDLQEEYQDWMDNLPENLQDSPVADKLDAVTGLYLDEALDILQEADDADLSLGFGRD